MRVQIVKESFAFLVVDLSGLFLNNAEKQIQSTAKNHNFSCVDL